jgi:hypothetical protein
VVDVSCLAGERFLSKVGGFFSTIFSSDDEKKRSLDREDRAQPAPLAQQFDERDDGL